MVTFVVVLVMVVSAVMGELDPPDSFHDSDGPTFEELKQLVEALEQDAGDALTTLGELETLCAINQERRADLLDRSFPYLLANNPRQDRAIGDLADQIKAMAHRMSTFRAQATATLEIAQGTFDATLDTEQSIADYVVAYNAQQQVRIDNLTAEMGVIKSQFLDNLNTTLSSLHDSLGYVVDDTSDLAASVDDVKCEYGYAALNPGMQNVTFVTPFTSEPVVSLYLTSFKFRLDKDKGYSKASYGYDHDYEPDLLVVDKFVETTSVDGFFFNLVNDSQGSVELLQAYCNWVACQNV